MACQKGDMIRKMLCNGCAIKARPSQSAEDIAMGWKTRWKQIASVRKPEEHEIEIHAEGKTVVEELSTVRCDDCNASVVDGSPGVAVTKWNSNNEDEPGAWEHQYDSSSLRLDVTEFIPPNGRREIIHVWVPGDLL